MAFFAGVRAGDFFAGAFAFVLAPVLPAAFLVVVLVERVVRRAGVFAVAVSASAGEAAEETRRREARAGDDSPWCGFSSSSRCGRITSL